MKKILGFFSSVRSESGFIRDQFSKIIWPTPTEASKIFAWTSLMLVTFGVLITFVFDPIAVQIIKALSSLK